MLNLYYVLLILSSSLGAWSTSTFIPHYADRLSSGLVHITLFSRPWTPITPEHAAIALKHAGPGTVILSVSIMQDY